MKKALTIIMTTAVLASGFLTLTSTPAKAAPGCFMYCNAVWDACTSDPCACVSIFEYCMADCQGY